MAGAMDNQEKIIRDIQSVIDEITEHQKQIEILKLQLKHIRMGCIHPNKYVHEDYKLEKTWHCPDCGWQS
jgi:hypothetical protein